MCRTALLGLRVGGVFIEDGVGVDVGKRYLEELGACSMTEMGDLGGDGSVFIEDGGFLGYLWVLGPGLG